MLNAKYKIADCHCDTISLLGEKDYDFGSLNTRGHIDLPRLQKGGIALQFFAICTAAGREGNHLQSALAQVGRYHRTLAENSAHLVSLESAGDYASGTNHTLPTGGYAKAYSGVSLDSFVKKITFQHITEEGVASIGTAVEAMAEAEELYAHKNAMTLRLGSIVKKNLPPGNTNPLLAKGETMETKVIEGETVGAEAAQGEPTEDSPSTTAYNEGTTDKNFDENIGENIGENPKGREEENEQF